jgi:hypothetical protein
VAGRAAAAVAELGKEGVEGKGATRGWRTVRLADAAWRRHHLGSTGHALVVQAQQTRVATKRKVPGSSDGEPPPPRVANIIIIWTDAAAPMPTSPPGNRVRNQVEGPQTPRHSRTSNMLPEAEVVDRDRTEKLLLT